MTLDDFAIELERDQESREAEVRFLQNLVAELDLSEDAADRYRRSLVLMLYAHFEGAVKFSLQTYLRFVNEQGLKVSEVSSAIAAASLNDVLHALRDTKKKCDLFRRPLPDDSALHRFARERDFVDQLGDVLSRPVSIKDGFVDMESNLKPVVLQKLLYQVGLDPRMFAEHDGTIHKLLAIRNKISHGESMLGVKAVDYDQLRTATLRVMTELKAGLRQSLRTAAYRRVAA